MRLNARAARLAYKAQHQVGQQGVGGLEAKKMMQLLMSVHFVLASAWQALLLVLAAKEQAWQQPSPTWRSQGKRGSSRTGQQKESWGPTGDRTSKQEGANSVPVRIAVFASLFFLTPPQEL